MAEEISSVIAYGLLKQHVAQGRLKAEHQCINWSWEHRGFWIFWRVEIALLNNLQRRSQMGMPFSQLAYFFPTYNMEQFVQSACVSSLA